MLVNADHGLKLNELAQALMFRKMSSWNVR
jgi:hypothetical protein